MPLAFIAAMTLAVPIELQASKAARSGALTMPAMWEDGIGAVDQPLELALVVERAQNPFHAIACGLRAAGESTDGLAVRQCLGHYRLAHEAGSAGHGNETCQQHHMVAVDDGRALGPAQQCSDILAALADDPLARRYCHIGQGRAR